jgi:hypothetical protein
LQRGVQPILVVGLESVCRPSDVTVGSDQQRTYLEVVDGTGHDVEAVRPSACGFADLAAGQIEQYRAAPVQKLGYPSPVVEGEVGHQPPRERMVAAYVVADVGAGEEVCHLFGDAWLLQ